MNLDFPHIGSEAENYLLQLCDYEFQPVSWHQIKYSLSIVWLLLHRDSMEEGPDFVLVLEMKHMDLWGLGSLLKVTQSVNDGAVR